MTLDVRACAVTLALVWGVLGMFVISLANLLAPDFGQAFLNVMASVYPGYNATPSIGQVTIATVYGVLDGAVGGGVFAWLYNRCARQFVPQGG
jgi:hypothetical protein